MLTFAQPAWFALLLLTIPVLMLHMRRRQSIVVGSIQIWRSVTSRATAVRTRKLPPLSWPLILQLLAIVLATVVLAQPRITSTTTSDHLLVVLDDSVAMDATGGLEAAREQLSTLLFNQDSGVASVLLTSAEAPVRMARAEAGKRQPWLERLPDSAGWSAADWDALDEAIPGLIDTSEVTELLVLTNSLADVPETLGGLPATIRTFGSEPATPWLQGTRVQETDSGWELQGNLRVPHDQDGQIQIRLSFRAFGDSDYLVWSEQTLDLTTLDEVRDGLYSFALPVELPLSGVLRLDLPGAGNSRLATANHVIHVQPVQARVLLAGNQPPELVRALAAIDGVALYTAASPAEAETGDFDLLVTSGLPMLAEPQTDVLSFVHPDAEPLQAPLTTHWSAAHVLSRGVNWSVLEVERAARLPLLDGATGLFAGNGLPLVQARTTPAGRQVVVAFEPGASNWPDLTGFPAFISNVLHWVVPTLQGGSPVACEPGQRCDLSSASLGLDTQLVSESGTELQPVVAGPTVFDFVIPLEPGVIWPQAVQAGHSEPLAVNPATVPFSPADSAATQEDATVAAAPPDLRIPLLIALAAVLIAESALVLSRLRGRPLRGPARRRQLQGVALRLLSIALVITAAFSPGISLPDTSEQVVVLVSDNSTGDTGQSRLLQQYEATARSTRPGQSVSLVTYADNASLTGSNDEERVHAGANLQAGLDLALARLDPSLPGSIVLASDGIQTVGDARETLPRLAAQETNVNVLHLQSRPAGEVQVERVLAPEQVYAHDRFTLHATVTADTQVPAVLRFYRDGELLAEREQDLLDGRNIVDLIVSETEAGEVLFEVEVEAEGDVHAANNRDGAYMQVLPPAPVLVVASQEEWGEVFADALRLQGLDATVVQPARAPYYLDGWLNYRGVVLLDVPSIDLSVLQQELLEQTIAEHGRGLLILGGPNSFGPGGYFETVLERVSPLSSRVPRDAPNVALAFVLDRSGSMQQSVDADTNRLDIAREATITAAGLLHEESRVSVIAFDSEATVLVPLQDELDLDEIETALRRVEPGGGTSLHPGLEAAYEQLQGVDAAARHVIVMSDGLSQPGDFDTLLGAMTAEGITVSTVAIGDGADVTSLQRYARMGEGAFHATRDFRALPSILSQESMMLSGAPIEENRAQPVWLSREQPFMQGLPAEVPGIDGFVLTTAKDGATVHMEVPDEEGQAFPLLASWRYGNGHVLAFTSQAAGPWTAEWISLPAYPLFWAQALRNFLPAAGQEGINLNVNRRGDELNVSVELLDEYEQRLGGQEVTVNGVRLRETAYGQYSGSLSLNRSGRFELEVTAGESSLVRNHHVGYPARMDFSLADPALLDVLAEASGGQVLTGGEPLFSGGHRHWSERPLWPLLLGLTLAVFLLELVNRYDPALLRKERRA